MVTDHCASSPGDNAALLVIDAGGSGVDQLRAGLWNARLDVDLIALGVLEVVGGIAPRGASLAALAMRKWGWRAMGGAMGGAVSITAVGLPVQYGRSWDSYRQVMALEVQVRGSRMACCEPRQFW